jgi:uncharacterized protein YicC (UPF0701 family)
MDEKEEDRSEESKKNHISYYKSLTKVISDIQEEKKQEVDPTVKNHLDARIQAMEEDKKRIKKLFPEIIEEDWDDGSNIS